MAGRSDEPIGAILWFRQKNPSGLCQCLIRQTLWGSWWRHLRHCSRLPTRLQMHLQLWDDSHIFWRLSGWSFLDGVWISRRDDEWWWPTRAGNDLVDSADPKAIERIYITLKVVKTDENCTYLLCEIEKWLSSVSLHIQKLVASRRGSRQVNQEGGEVQHI